MRIVDKVQFTLGVFNIIVGVGITIAAIIQHRYTKIVSSLFSLGVGIMLLCQSVETRKQRQEKEERLKALARVLGLDGDDC